MNETIAMFRVFHRIATDALSFKYQNNEQAKQKRMKEALALWNGYRDSKNLTDSALTKQYLKYLKENRLENPLLNL